MCQVAQSNARACSPTDPRRTQVDAHPWASWGPARGLGSWHSASSFPRNVGQEGLVSLDEIKMCSGYLPAAQPWSTGLLQ